MEYRFLGNSGLRVSNLCMGCMTFGGKADFPGNLDQEGAEELLNKFVKAGGNFIDTADVYHKGESEEIVGNWLAKQNRDSLVIATKVRFPSDPTDPNAVGLSRKHIIAGVDNALKRLKTNYIDLLQCHCWDAATPIEETLQTMLDLTRSGKVRYFGVSNFTGWQLQKMADRARALGVPIVSIQAQYNLLCRVTEWEVAAVCASEGIGLLPWSPLKGGWLSGKLKRDQPPPAGSRVEWAEKTNSKLQSAPTFSKFKDDDSVWKLLESMETIGKAHEKTVAQVAIRWLLQQSTVPSVVIGAKTVQQLEDNIGAASGWSLTPDELEQLGAASAVDIPYPYEMVWRCQADRTRPQGGVAGGSVIGK